MKHMYANAIGLPISGNNRIDLETTVKSEMSNKRCNVGKSHARGSAEEEVCELEKDFPGAGDIG